MRGFWRYNTPAEELNGFCCVLGLAAVALVFSAHIGTDWPWYGFFAWLAIFLAPVVTINVVIAVMRQFVWLRVAGLLALAGGFLYLVFLRLLALAG